MNRLYKSPNLRKHGDSQEVIQWMLFAIAVLFWIAAKAKDDPIMPAAVYGVFVTSIEAEVWAASIMLAAGAYLLGIVINGNWRWSPALRLVGASWHFLTLSTFAVGALGTQYGDFFTLATGTFAVVHGWFVWLNLRDLRFAIGGLCE